MIKRSFRIESRKTRLLRPQIDLNQTLIVGLCTVSTRKTSYLVETVKSLIENLSRRTKTKIIIYHCDWEDVSSKDIPIVEEKFSKEISSGLLKIIRVSNHHQFGLNKVDKIEYGSWIEKQSYDLSEACRLSYNQANYYLHVEDDILACKNYDIKIFEEMVKNKKWGAVRFAGGMIGWLFHNEDLPKMAELLIKHRKELPCDWIAEHKFIHYLFETNRTIIKTKYSLFQHKGMDRSLTNDVNTVVFNNFIDR